MSETADLDRREQIVRIDRMIEEGRKFAAEQHKLSEEANNLRVSRFVTPVAAAVAATGSVIAAVSGVLAVFLHFSGH